MMRRVSDLDVDAVAGLAGSRAAMHFSMIILNGPLEFDLGSTTRPNITCLAVSGHVAEVGFRNDSLTPPPDQPYLGYGFATFVDGGPVGSGQDLVAANFGTTRTDPSVCTIPTDLSSLLPLETGDVSVNDASAAP